MPESLGPEYEWYNGSLVLQVPTPKNWQLRVCSDL